MSLPTILDDQNIKNRIILWISALASTERNLLLAERANAWSKTDEVSKEVRQNGSNIYDYTKNDPYSQTRLRPFPILFECDDIIFGAYSSAIMYYSQLLSSGNADGEKISSNSKNLKKNLWDISFEYLKIQNISKSEIESLNKSILQARDGMIAHADARQFEASFDKNGRINSFKSYQQSWDSLNGELWLKVTYKLKNYLTLLSSR